MLLVLWLLACDTTVESDFPTCEVEMMELDPVAAAPGETVNLLGRPLTESWDTVIRVGGVNAEVVAVSREDCTECDSCQEAASCNPCLDCDACDRICEICEESVQFVVPDLDPGTAHIEIFNAHGSSGAAANLLLQVLAGDSGG